MKGWEKRNGTTRKQNKMLDFENQVKKEYK